eukprot:CAMPEP_0115507224 /NCGR_PEP_ID=MMETSP0271-20121206/71606_1 /TAXON_ID=71861 /ORGANISM="Scrippsiella trochoidea, Strain CCMP3099" /LENGTH=292 /DNA_ID=CAMNT_0002936789 /DNA_START=304 /DNA_END=1182 /DNA_ORIENTATION=+
MTRLPTRFLQMLQELCRPPSRPLVGPHLGLLGTASDNVIVSPIAGKAARSQTSTALSKVISESAAVVGDRGAAAVTDEPWLGVPLRRCGSAPASVVLRRSANARSRSTVWRRSSLPLAQRYLRDSASAACSSANCSALAKRCCACFCTSSRLGTMTLFKIATERHKSPLGNLVTGAAVTSLPAPAATTVVCMRSQEATTELAKPAHRPATSTHGVQARCSSSKCPPKRTLLGEHALQTHLPHSLQWCRLEAIPKRLPQMLQVSVFASHTQSTSTRGASLTVESPGFWTKVAL